MSVPRCERRWCGVPMIEQHDRVLGRVAFDCPACKRNRAGLCRDCPKRLDEPNALRCRTCARARLTKRDLDRRNKRYREDPAFRKKMILRKRAERRDPERRARVLERERASRRRRAAERPATKTHDPLNALYQREWRRNHPLTDRQRRRMNAKRRRRYAMDAEFRAKKKADNAKRSTTLSAEEKARRNARFRERYATDPAFRKQVNDRTYRNAKARRRRARGLAITAATVTVRRASLRKKNGRPPVGRPARLAA